jgi:hypothetical protein
MRDDLMPDLEIHFRRVAMTLQRVFHRVPGPFMDEYRAAVAGVPEKHRKLAMHEEPFEVAARLLGYREGGPSEDIEYLNAYERFRESPEWEAAESAIDSLEGTVAIVRAYVTNNLLPVEAVSGLIKDVHSTLTAMNDASTRAKPPQESRSKPAATQAPRKAIVQIARSVALNYKQIQKKARQSA